uniref:G_PROTEIN_RECEP_F1_2 domain-containing protein n=1 Tax=Elaeophora elaphi TaxID=1147741 RepID=A0A0R3RG20_9BILA
MDLTANDTITQSVNTFVNKEGRMLSAVNYVLRTYAYVFAGVLLIVINIPVSLIMIMRKTLRGSYLILAVLFFNNGFTGIGALLLGMKRLIYADNRRALVNHYHCVLDVSVLLLTAYFLNGFSLLMTSVERLCAVAFPIYYYTHNSRISYSLIAAQYIITVIAIAATVIASFIEPARFISHLCLLQNIYSPYFYKALLLLGAVASSLSVIFMIIVVVVLRKKFGAQFLSSHSQNNDLSHFLNNQKRYTHTAIISCSLTFCTSRCGTINSAIY